jgi:hypothetical protein
MSIPDSNDRLNLADGNRIGKHASFDNQTAVVGTAGRTNAAG